MNILRTKIISFRDILATAWPTILITCVGFFIAYQFVQPAPPRTIIMSSGPESGVYYAYAQQYAEFLKNHGITLEVQTSTSSWRNLQRLKNGEAHIAIVQGGIRDDTLSEDGKESLFRTLGSIAYEPIWVFYKNDAHIDKLFLLRDFRIAVGQAGSSIRGLSMRLLQANDVMTDNETLFPLEDNEAVNALLQGDIDAVFVIAPPDAEIVQKLLNAPEIKVMGFSQADAYLRRFPFLSKIVLPRGVVNLVHDLPPQDTVLLATTANIVIRNDFHPALSNLLLQAMVKVNGKGGFFQRSGEFPVYKDQGFLLADEAERYYQSGPPFLQRYFPFWFAILIERMLVLVLPVVIVLLPLLRFAPVIYNWRVRSKIFRCYGDLKFMEHELREKYDHSRKDEYLGRLNRIEDDAFSKNVPLSFSDQLYTLREHVNLVREKLAYLESGETSKEKP
ncbi:MAG: hypothetical protein LBH05_07245 [Deferribacteraceae bacterium]|jgi:TRAP-type uncharacterized transport system substrate-binding protein|nr:hypothetical protein [Deferribacteraceae bacterium]